MDDRNRIVMGALLVLTSAPLAAWAGPPFRTDDPEAVEYQHAEFYVFTQQTLGADARTGVLPAFEFNYGIHEKVQLHLTVPYAFTTPSGQGSTRGYGDTELGIKWQLNDETDTLPIIGLFPLLEIPTGNERKGLGSGATQVFIPLWIQKRWGRFQTYGGGGYWFNSNADNENYWFFGWQAQYQFSEKLTLGSEAFHTTQQVAGQCASSGFNVGGFYNFDRHHHLLFSAGKGLKNAAETNRVSTYLGYQYTY
jgi:hypothetical protein